VDTPLYGYASSLIHIVSLSVCYWQDFLGYSIKFE